MSIPRPEQASTSIEGIRVVTLEKLIELKVASGMTAPDRLPYLAEVQERIKIKNTGAEYAERLDPYPSPDWRVAVLQRYLQLVKRTCCRGC